MSRINHKWTDNSVNKSIPKQESGNFTALYGNLHIIADHSGHVTATLPAPVEGAKVVIKSLASDITANNIEINTVSGNIDGHSQFHFNVPLQSVSFVSDGSNWHVETDYYKLGFEVAKNLNTGSIYDTIQDAIDDAATNEVIGIAGKSLGHAESLNIANKVNLTLVGFASPLGYNTSINGKMTVANTVTNLNVVGIRFQQNTAADFCYVDNGSGNTTFTECSFKRDADNGNCIQINSQPPSSYDYPRFNNCNILDPVENLGTDTTKFVKFESCMAIGNIVDNGASGIYINRCTMSGIYYHNAGMATIGFSTLAGIESTANDLGSNFPFIKLSNTNIINFTTLLPAAITKTGSCDYSISNVVHDINSSTISGTDVGSGIPESFAYRFRGALLSVITALSRVAGVIHFGTDTGRAYLDDGTSLKALAFQSDITNNLTVSKITGNTTASANTCYVIDGNNGAINVTLPSSHVDGDSVYIKALTVNILANPVTIVPNGTDKIDGVNANYSLDADVENVRLVSDGTDWFRV